MDINFFFPYRVYHIKFGGAKRNLLIFFTYCSLLCLFLPFSLCAPCFLLIDIDFQLALSVWKLLCSTFCIFILLEYAPAQYSNYSGLHSEQKWLRFKKYLGRIQPHNHEGKYN